MLISQIVHFHADMLVIMSHIFQRHCQASALSLATFGDFSWGKLQRRGGW